MSNIKETSKKEFVAETTSEAIKLGCLQRIADSTELIANNYSKMLYDLQFYKKRSIELESKIAGKNRTISALKGQITTLKKKNA